MSTFQKPNKNIDNASGQVVREDMEDTLKAVAAHNYGPLSTGGELLPTEFIAEIVEHLKNYLCEQQVEVL